MIEAVAAGRGAFAPGGTFQGAAFWGAKMRNSEIWPFLANWCLHRRTGWFVVSADVCPGRQIPSRRHWIEVHKLKLLTGKEQVDYTQFFMLADMPHVLRGHEKKQEAQLLLGDRATRKHAKDSWNGRGNDNLGWMTFKCTSRSSKVAPIES